MLSRLLVFYWAVTMLSNFNAAAETVTVNSENIKDLLIDKNAKVAAVRYDKAAAKEREGFLFRSFLPSLDFHGAQESFKVGNLKRDQPTYGVEAKINLFNSGHDEIENNLRLLETKRLSFQEQRVSSEELEKARTLYWQILYLQEKVSLLNSAIDINKQNLASALRRIKSGVATLSDRFEFEMKEVDLRRENAETELELVTETRLLGLLLGLKEGVKLSFSEMLKHDHDYENSLKHSEKQHDFLFKEFELLAEQKSLSAKKGRRAWWPQVDTFAAYNEYNQRIESAEDKRQETVLGLRMTMSISAGLESNYEARALLKQASASRMLAEYQRREVEAHLQSEVTELKLLHDQVHEAEENIKRAEQYYKITQSEYARGAKNSPDVLVASEKLFDMRHQYLKMMRDFQVSTAHLLSKIGQ